MNAPVISILTLSRAKSCFLSALASITLLSGVLHAAEIVVDQPAGTGLTDNAATTTFTSTIAGSTGIAKTYTITNLGSSSGNLTGIDVVLTGAGAGNFSLDKTGLATSLTPGASTTFTVAFSPLSTGAKTAGLEIISNDADENPFNITLSGTGVATTVTLSSTGTTQTVTVPDGVSAITVEAWGGGGNGSGSPSGHGGGGGGGGAYARKVINGPLSPTYSVFVGAAGQDSTFNTNVVVAKAGSAGSATSFGAGGSATSSVGDVKRKGGDGGYEGAYNPASGGGGSASTSADGIVGQNALSNSTAGAGGAGWGVGTPAEGSGGNGGDNNVVGTAGSVPGGGGGGGGKGRPAGSTGGGAGAAGRVVLTFAAALPEIDVTGNGQSIVDGDITPDLSDHTNFGDVLLGSQQTRTYTIQNLGSAPLTLGTVGVTGSGFSVTSQPIPPVAPNGSTTFDITFTPTATGVSSGTVSFSHNDTDENPYNFVIQGNGTVIPITVTNPVTDSGTAGQAFSQTFTQSNAVGTATFATTSTLPNGLTLGTDGTLSGTPTQTGTFPIVVTCTDSNSTVGTGSTYNLTIACQSITVINPANTGGTVGMIFSETFMQNGAIGTATFTTTSTLPNGVTLSSSGVLSGMPTQTGSFPIVVTVTDSNNCTGTSATYNLSINCQLIAVNSPTNAAGTVGDVFSETFTQTGALGAATFTTASALPNGLTLSSSGTLSGTPTQDGTFPIVVTVTDMNNCTGSSSVYSLVIAPAVPEIAVYDGNGTGGTERTDNTGAHDFGSVNTGSSSAAQTFTLQNTGNANLTGIAVSSTSADFIVDASGLSSTLAPNATTSFTVIFSPAAASPAGGRSGVVNIASNDSDENPFEINVSGTAAVAPGAITQLGTTGSSVGSNDNTLEGYTVPAGTSRALIVTASHADEADITGVTFNGQPLTQVVELSGGPVDSIWVRAMGTSGTGTTGDIVVTRSGIAAEQQIILAAVYENVNQTTPMDSPMSSSDSSVNSSSSLTVTSEPGDLVFDLTSIFPSTAVMNSTPGAGQTRLHGPLDVTLDSFSYASWSTSTKAGAASVTMSWTSNGDYIQHVAANINIATASAPEIAVYDGNGTGGTERADNVGNVGFGSVNTGSSSAAQTFTVQNTGAADLTLGTVTLTGTDDGEFSVTQPLSTTLAANATTTFTITFSPSTAGAKSAVVNIASNDGDENPFRINVGGTGLSNTAPVITSYSGLVNVPISANENGLGIYATVTATDADVPAQTLTYSLGGPDAALFYLTPGGQLLSRTVLDFEMPTDQGGNNVYEVTVTVTDNGSPNLSAVQNFAFTILNVNDAPTVTAIPDQTLAVGGSTGPLAFTIGDTEPTPVITVLSPTGIAGTRRAGTASFGPATFSVTADVVIANPAQATGPLVNAAACAGKIVIVDRGLVTFAQKAAAVQAAGGVGMILVNNVANVAAPGLGGTDPTITIPSMGLSLEDGAVIKAGVMSGPVVASLDSNGQPELKLTVTAASSNTTLVPNANIVLGGTGAARNVAVTPAAGESGMTVITVTVSDGTLTSSREFLVFVGGPAPYTAFTETFEDAADGYDVNGWNHTPLTGSPDWVWSTARSHSATHSWYAQSGTNNAHRTLLSPLISVNSTSQLSFYHTYAFEIQPGLEYDGGTLEYSADGMTWSTVPDAAFLSGGFNGTVSQNFTTGNVLKGKRAWVGGTAGALTQVVVNLASFANGQTIRLRWHAGDDQNTVEEGWYVDEVVLTGGSPEIAVFDGIAPPANERTDNAGTHNFGSVNTGSSSAAQTFTIQNAGTADLTLGTVTLTGADAGQFSVTQPVSTTLAANATTTFTVTFNPSTAGAKSAVVNIASNDGDENPFEIQVGGTGLVVVSQLTMPPQTGTFSTNARGYWFVAPRDMTITGLQVPTTASTGNQSIAVVKFNSAVPVFSATTNDFETLYLTQNNSNSGVLSVNIPIPSGSIVGVLGVRNNVNSYATGPVASSIFGMPVTLSRLGMQFPLASTAPQDLWTELAGSISRVDLYAVPGILPTNPEMAVEDYFNSDLVDNNTFYRVPFGTADVGTTITRSFTIKNTGSGALSIGAITFDGSEFAAFAVTNPPPASIPAGGQASFDVTFTAITERGHAATMHIVNGDADENPFDIRIGGVGTTYTGGTWTGSPALIEMPPNESFYADGLNFDTELGFIPTPGQSYTFINIQGAPPAGVVGHFNDLPDGGVVAMSFNGVIYYFQADYEGGTGGNDLVLRNFTPSDQPMWKWVSGPKSRNGIGVYGDQYEPSETNNPGARQGAMNWLAPNGNLWLFGGYGYGTALTNPPRWLNDLWEYDRTLGQWIWHSGSTTHSVDSTYGDMGTGDPANTPGARHTSGTWTDVRGNLWLYGGYSKGNWHNDLWRYDARFGEWTWVHGSNTPNAAPVRGTLGVPDAANTPGARSSVTTWFVPDFPDPIDFVPGGKLYLFGGYNGTTHYNDLWSYDISSGEWTWLGGGSLPNQNGVYGTQGVSDVANIPGSRRDASAFVGHDGCLYLFGGQGYGASGTTRGDLNDLWKFDPAAGVNGLWTWVNGSNATGAAGSYGALNTPAAGNSPPARSAGSGWVTVDGKFWLVGGFKNSNLAYNDIWTFDPVTGLWTWKQGAAGTLSVAGVYGAHGTAAAGNQPGSRFTPSTWVTLNGTLWLFGGGGADGFGNTGRMSDLWSYGIPNPLGTPLDNSEPAPFPDALIVNANPNTGNATAGTTAYVPVSGKLLGTDADGDKISFSSTSATTISQGTLTLNANGTWTYTPAYGFTGIASFQFRAADAYGGQSAIRTLVITVSTNPADSDGDGIADDYERSLWGDLASADGDGDADFDGQSNYFEFLAGTNPLSGSEALHTAPAVTGTAAANGSIELQLNHVRPGVLYHLETSPDLEQWSRVGTFDFSVAGSATVQDPSPSTGAPKFYRMSLEATPAVILP